MKVSTIGKAGAAFAAFGTVAGPYAAVAGATPTHASAAASATAARTTAARSAYAFPLPGDCAANDYRVQSAVHVVSDSGTTGSDVVELMYSPSTRCVYGKFINVSRTCGQVTILGRNACNLVLYQTDSSGGNAQATGICGINSGDQSCVTEQSSDAGVLASAIGEKRDGQHWIGKTSWF